jgi:hypothetical protein
MLKNSGENLMPVVPLLDHLSDLFAAGTLAFTGLSPKLNMKNRG